MQSRTDTTRTLAAKGALAVSAGTLMFLALPSLRFGRVDWDLFGAALAVFGAAAVLGGRRLGANVLARGVAWALLVTSAVGTAVMAASGHAEPSVALIGATSALALALSHRSLSTASARAAFAPVTARRWLLAACSASFALASVCALLAIEQLRWGHPGVLPFALVLAYVGSAVGVLRMRGWGLLLGGATALFAAAGALYAGGPERIALLAAALPGLMMLTPIARAKLARRNHAATRGLADAARVRVSTPSDHLDVDRVRIATDDELDEHDVSEREDRAPRAGAVAV